MKIREDMRKFKKIFIKYFILVYLPIFIVSWIFSIFLLSIFIDISPTDIAVGTILGSGVSFILYGIIFQSVYYNRRTNL